MKRLAIIVCDDGFDKLLTPLSFAHALAMRGVEVDMMFVLWAVRVLTREGAAQLSIDGRHDAELNWLRQRLGACGAPADIATFLEALVASGRIRLFACRYAAETFEVQASELIPWAEGIIDPTDFLIERPAGADTR